MRIFKHGDALAIVFPQSMVSSSDLKDGEELDFIEVEKGVFVLLRKEKLAELARSKVDKALNPQTAAFAPALPKPGLMDFFKRELQSKGFIVVFGEDGAKQVSESMEKEIKSGLVVGTRGFDKKFYVATKEFLERQTPKVVQALKVEALSPKEIAEKTKYSDEAVTAILGILMDEGEVIEKKKGLYSLA